MLMTTDYDRQRAVAYANEWAYRRNPRFLDFQELGGDCTNFVSQCLYYANSVMNFTPTFGWYYLSADNRTASWTGVTYLYNFLISNEGPGPYARQTTIDDMLIGDVIQLGGEDGTFHHSLIVTKLDGPPTPATIQVAAHTNDSLCRPLDTYSYADIRFLHIEGVRYTVDQ